jgi:hypothetical protein
MVLRTPLILISGGFSQLPSGDVVPGLDVTAQASGNAALVVANSALASGTAAQASGNAALVVAASALASVSTFQTLTNTAVSLASGASTDFTVNAGNVFTLLQVTSSHPAWIRVYDTNAARSADARVIPGAPYPTAGSGFYAEVLTNTTPQSITMSPIALCQGVSGVAYVRKQNRSGAVATVTSDYYVLTLASGV